MKKRTPPKSEQIVRTGKKKKKKENGSSHRYCEKKKKRVKKKKAPVQLHDMRVDLQQRHPHATAFLNGRSQPKASLYQHNAVDGCRGRMRRGKKKRIAALLSFLFLSFLFFFFLQRVYVCVCVRVYMRLCWLTCTRDHAPDYSAPATLRGFFCAAASILAASAFIPRDFSSCARAVATDL